MNNASNIGTGVSELVHDGLLVMSESGPGEPKYSVNNILAEIIANYSLTEVLSAISESAACASDFAYDCAEDEPGNEHANVLQLRLKTFQKRLDDAITALR